jgi:Ca-activated chloride channel homolog
MNIGKLFLFAVCFLLMTLELRAQQQTQPSQQPILSEQVSVSLVNLYASVRNSHGRPVYGLTLKDFSLSVNGKRQKITNFSADITEPVNIAFLLDVSGSMRMLDKFEIAQSIIRKVIAQMGPEDEASLIIFADSEAEMLVPFTTDKLRVVARMDKLKAYGGTALRDALAYCHRLLIESVGKKAVVLLSDGVDNRSELTLEQATSQAAKVELPIYAFELIKSKWVNDTKEKDIDELPLKAFAEATGGLYFAMDVPSDEEVAKACSKIFEDLKYQYYIGYTPQGTDSSYGRVELTTKNPKDRIRVRYSVVHGD